MLLRCRAFAPLRTRNRDGCVSFRLESGILARMTVTLRPYQFELRAAVFAAWSSGAKNVVMRADTGAGKTAILSSIVNEHRGASCVIAHRHEKIGRAHV